VTKRGRIFRYSKDGMMRKVWKILFHPEIFNSQVCVYYATRLLFKCSKSKVLLDLDIKATALVTIHADNMAEKKIGVGMLCLF